MIDDSNREGLDYFNKTLGKGLLRIVGGGGGKERIKLVERNEEWGKE